MSATAFTTADLARFAQAIAGGTVRVVDLTQTLSPEFPTIVLPPELTYHPTMSHDWLGSAQGFCSRPLLIVTLQTNALAQR